jgi:hypothetical protein
MGRETGGLDRWIGGCKGDWIERQVDWIVGLVDVSVIG